MTVLPSSFIQCVVSVTGWDYKNDEASFAAVPDDGAFLHRGCRDPGGFLPRILGTSGARSFNSAQSATAGNYASHNRGPCCGTTFARHKPDGYRWTIL